MIGKVRLVSRLVSEYRVVSKDSEDMVTVIIISV